VASYCIKIVKAAGYRIPDDISVCGFTNSYLTEVTDPTLTSVDQHGFEMGRTAARLLINRIEGRETKGRGCEPFDQDRIGGKRINPIVIQ